MQMAAVTDIRKVKTQLRQIDLTYGTDLIEKCKPNPEVCAK
jgi:hypothetical protein